ncbi:HAD family hydrolase [Mucilaginibacter litoreus]|uniref:HAD family hydrolase n=1 Tax=Mucilaginibacter litoreus TaxID=1048221 RepID=A0ABW3AU44_9SPHI
MKRALILDLDNTIYPVSSIADKLFLELFELIDEKLADKQAAAKAKHELTRRPYQHVADEYGFSDDLRGKGIELLKNLTFNEPMQPFKEYNVLRKVKADKYLVTTGFTKLQYSKVKMLGIADDFKNIYVVDPELSSKNKGDVFQQIMIDNGYIVEDLLVIGDDPQSEIKFANELGIDTFLFDPANKHSGADVTYRAADYRDVAGIVN